MPWNTLTQMEEIIRFVSLAQTDRFTLTDLCEQFSISRKTAYKHLERYAEGGLAALAPRSHRSHGCPQRTVAVAVFSVLSTKREAKAEGVVAAAG
jgi:predicted ArsR family transcriptional regulator